MILTRGTKTPTIKIKLNVLKDAQNWWYGCHCTAYGVDWKKRIDKKLSQKILARNKKQAFNFLVPYLRRSYVRNETNRLMPLVQAQFDKAKKVIFSRMRILTGHQIYRDTFTCYLTTFPRAPYNTQKGEVWLPVEWSNMFLDIFIHELLHFQTIYYFKNIIVKRIRSEEVFDHIKEALTVVLNTEFKDILHRRDTGYKLHRKLRTDLLNRWKKKKNFNALINYAISVYPCYENDIARYK